MNQKNKQDLAVYWQKILRSKPRRLFGKHSRALRNYNEDDWIAQPGYVGSQYRSGGLLFVGANPGGPKCRKLSAGDRRQYELLQALRNATESELLAAFTKLNKHLCRSMKSWNIYATYIPKILTETGIEFSDVAFINLVKWRTVDQKMPRQLLEISWRRHSRDQLMLLRPSVIICLGNIAGRFIHRVFGMIIPRTIKDGYVSDQTSKAIHRARRYLRQNW